MALVEIESLTVKYIGRKNPTLTGVTLSLRQGETVLLLGPSGCGKSTLALTLNGLIPHSVGATLNGRVIVDRLDTQQTSVAELAQKVGIVFQDPEAQFATLKVEDEIVFGLENLCRPPEIMNAKIDEALAQVGMAHARSRPLHTLSSGEKQRVALAALLVMEPAVLVFDEPTANLDPVGTQDVFALLAAQKAQGRHTIILIEHKLDELMRLIDRVIVLGNQGNLLADGAPRQVFRDQAGLLQMHGVWTPQVCMLAHRLGPSQLELEPFPITLEEMEAALRDKVIGRKDDFLSLSDQALLPDPPAAAPAIEVRNLSFSYGPNRALADISLQAPHGDFLAIVGANGAGKTTLAQHFIGILTPPPATVFVNGQDVSQISGRELARQVGYVFQNPEHQFITDSVFDEVAYGLRVMGLAGSEIETRTIQLLDMFGLVYYAKANPFTLSHGEKRRLSVATMLAMGQRILILDEPTFGQDQRNAEALLSLLVGLHHKGCTVIVITHDMTLVAEYARRVAVMAAGQLLFHGVPHALFAQPELLAQARLTLPPLARLASRLAEYQPQLRECITLAEFSRLEIRNAEIGALANRSEK